MDIFEPFSKFKAMEHEAEMHRCITAIIKDYRSGTDVNDDFYLDSVGFFDFSLQEQKEIIREVTMELQRSY